jgi:hypothetical protein
MCIVAPSLAFSETSKREPLLVVVAGRPHRLHFLVMCRADCTLSHVILAAQPRHAGYLSGAPLVR